jgi:hypothetical protein
MNIGRKQGPAQRMNSRLIETLAIAFTLTGEQ